MEDIREEIKKKIKANRREEITGHVLQGVLLDMADKMEEGAVDVVQTIGDSPEVVMSQGSVTRELQKKQNIVDESLSTENKTVPGAINEIIEKIGGMEGIILPDETGIIPGIYEKVKTAIQNNVPIYAIHNARVFICYYYYNTTDGELDLRILRTENFSQAQGLNLFMDHYIINNDDRIIRASSFIDVYSAVRLKAEFQKILTAGPGIAIDDDTISCTLDTNVFKVVDVLPETPGPSDGNKIFIVPSEHTEEGNRYTEYVHLNGSWEKLGEFKANVDLSEYAKTETVNEQITALGTEVAGATTAATGAKTAADAAQQTANDAMLVAKTLGENANAIAHNAVQHADTATVEAIEAGLKAQNAETAATQAAANVEDLREKLDGMVFNLPYRVAVTTTDPVKFAEITGMTPLEFREKFIADGGNHRAWAIVNTCIIPLKYRLHGDTVEFYRQHFPDNKCFFGKITINTDGTIVTAYWYASESYIVNTLSSASTELPLAANMGRELKEQLDKLGNSSSEFSDNAELNALVKEVYFPLLSDETISKIRKVDVYSTYMDNNTLLWCGITLRDADNVMLVDYSNSIDGMPPLAMWNRQLIDFNKAGYMAVYPVDEPFGIKTFDVKRVNIAKNLMDAPTIQTLLVKQDVEELKEQVGALEDLIQPAGGYNRHLYETDPDVKFNEATGYYELNRLTDITETEMADIWRAGNAPLTERGRFAYYQNIAIRTNLRPRGLFNPINISDSAYFCFGQLTLEYLKLCNSSFTSVESGTFDAGTSLQSAFYNCKKLSVIEGLINANRCATADTVINTFYNCHLLKEVRLQNLRVSLNVQYSALLSLDSIKYIITANRASTAIAITLHSEAYARAIADADITAALEAYPLVSLADVGNTAAVALAEEEEGVKLTNREAYSATRFVHRLNTDHYGKRLTLLPRETADDFEEVDAIPEPEESEEDRRMREEFEAMSKEG
ncbi:MAG: hypothetical protein NC115_12180 [Bacteroidales bacterium]|nr:hypothetical protein [Bacteroidales bacterium]